MEVRNDLSEDVTGSVAVEVDGESVSEAFDVPAGVGLTYDDLMPAPDTEETTYRVSVTTDGRGSARDELSAGSNSGIVRVIVIIEPEGIRIEPLYI